MKHSNNKIENLRSYSVQSGRPFSCNKLQEAPIFAFEIIVRKPRQLSSYVMFTIGLRSISRITWEPHGSKVSSRLHIKCVVGYVSGGFSSGSWRLFRSRKVAALAGWDISRCGVAMWRCADVVQRRTNKRASISKGCTARTARFTSVDYAGGGRNSQSLDLSYGDAPPTHA